MGAGNYVKKDRGKPCIRITMGAEFLVTENKVCVCVWSMACFFLCISMNFILLLFSSFCKKCVFVSACLCEVSQAGFSLQKFPTAVSLFIFFQLQLDRFTWESIGLKVVYT